MSTFFFDLNDGLGIVRDLDGADLRDAAAARAHAERVARELLRHAESKRRGWRLRVRDQNGGVIFELLFASVDESLNHLAPGIKASIEDVHVKAGALSDTIRDVRHSMAQLRATMRRSNKTPWLAAIDGAQV